MKYLYFNFDAMMLYPFAVRSLGIRKAKRPDAMEDDLLKVSGLMLRTLSKKSSFSVSASSSHTCLCEDEKSNRFDQPQNKSLTTL